MLRLRILLILLCTCVSLGAQEDAGTAFPDPNRLLPGWWPFFRSEDPELAATRAQQASERFGQQAAALPQELQDEATTLMLAFQKSLETLSLPKDVPGPLPVAPIIAERYSVGAYLDLAKQVREAQAIEAALRHQVAQAREGSGLDERAYESRLARFRSEDQTPTAERFIMGLRLMLNRAQIAIDKQQIELLSEEIRQRAAYRASIEELLPEAASRVSTLGEDTAGLAAAVQARKDELLVSSRRGVELVAPAGGGAALPEMLYAQETLALMKLLNAEMHLSLGNADDTDEDYSTWSQELQRMGRLTEYWREFGSETLLRFSRQPGDVPEQERDYVITLLNVAGELDEQVFLGRQLLSLVQTQRLQRRAPLARTLDYLWINAMPAWESVAGWLYYPFTFIGEDEVPLSIWSLLKVALIFTLTVCLSRVLTGRLGELARRRGGLSPTNFQVFGRLLHYSLLSLAALVSLSVIGLRASTLLVLGGALGIGVGFGLQSFVQNFVSGLTILFERNFRIGDYIRLPTGEIGEVKEINTQSTVIHAFDGMDIVVPNGQLISLSIANWTLRDPFLRLHIPFGVAYGSDPQKVREIVLLAAGQFQSTLQDAKREPQVWMKELADSSMNFELVVWVNVFKYPRHNSTRAAYLEAIERALVENGVTIPFPQRDLHIKSSSVALT